MSLNDHRINLIVYILQKPYTIRILNHKNVKLELSVCNFHKPLKINQDMNTKIIINWCIPWNPNPNSNPKRAITIK